MIKKEQIQALFTNPTDKQLANMVVALFNRQMKDEKNSNHTSHNNNIGFNGGDAFGLTLAAKWCIKNRNVQPFALPDWMRAKLLKRLYKYSGQLAEIANDPNYKPLFHK